MYKFCLYILAILYKAVTRLQKKLLENNIAKLKIEIMEAHQQSANNVQLPISVLKFHLQKEIKEAPISVEKMWDCLF